MRLALALVMMAGAVAAKGALDPPILQADLVDPTGRYDHAVLGDALEWGGLRLVVGDRTVTLTLPENRFFEDVEARLADVTGDGAPEVIVVETDLAQGASLALYGPKARSPQPRSSASAIAGWPPPGLPISTATGGSRSPMSTARTCARSWSLSALTVTGWWRPCDCRA